MVSLRFMRRLLFVMQRFRSRRLDRLIVVSSRLADRCSKRLMDLLFKLKWYGVVFLRFAVLRLTLARLVLRKLSVLWKRLLRFRAVRFAAQVLRLSTVCRAVLSVRYLRTLMLLNVRLSLRVLFAWSVNGLVSALTVRFVVRLIARLILTMLTRVALLRLLLKLVKKRSTSLKHLVTIPWIILARLVSRVLTMRIRVLRSLVRLLNCKLLRT